ncbi:MAG1430 family protein [Mycoplasmopsis iners]|uniref:MAG1430 family protein n=1 Tax=Mycoplasmopsis iners TaxID=76630 RepID=UPI000495754F|nr:hypothetical protein [Mycoplasmopsis iners]
MKNKLKIGLLSTSLALSTAAIVTTGVLIAKQSKVVDLQSELTKYNFTTIPSFNKAEHLPSEYSYVSYDLPYSSELRDPNLKTDANAKSFWAKQLEIQSNSTELSGKIFNLVTKNNQPIDVLKEKYNIFYQSFANDEEGVLYLKINLEDKNDSRIKTSSSIADRRVYWTGFTYKIDGFKKLTSEDYEAVDRNYSLWDFKATAKLNLDFSNNVFNNAQDFLNVLHKKNVNEESLDTIKTQNENTKKYLTYSLNNNVSHPFYQLDEKSEIWFDNDLVDNNITINYYVNKVIPVASTEDNSSLDAVKLVRINQVQSQKIKINIEQLKALLPLVKINVLNNKDLSNITPYGDDFVYFTGTSDDNHHNTSKGWYRDLDLVFDDTVENKNQYILRYYLLNPTDGSIKTDVNFKGKPIINYDSATGSATFAYEITLKNASDANGILSIISSYVLSETFKKSSIEANENVTTNPENN